MFKKMLILFIGLVLAIAFPLAVSASQPISGTPTWQNVPNLGEEYGYYWTDTSGDTVFVICDQTTGQPTSIYEETVAANTGYNTVTKQVTETSTDLEDANASAMMTFLYPAADGSSSYAIPYGGTGTIVSSDTGNDGYGVVQFYNQNDFPVNVDLDCLASCNGGKYNASASTNVTVPYGAWYFEVPLPNMDSGGYISQVNMQEYIQYAVGSDGNAYPLLGTSGTSPGMTSNTAYLLTDTLNAYTLTVDSYPGYSVQGGGDLGVMTQGFVEEQKFVPTINASVGQLESYSAPANIFELVGTSAPPYIDYTNDTFYDGHLTPNYDIYGLTGYTLTGYVIGTLENPTPIPLTIVNSSSMRINGSYMAGGDGMTYGGTLYGPSPGTTVPPNGSVQVGLGVSISLGTYIGSGNGIPSVLGINNGWGSSFGAGTSNGGAPNPVVQLNSAASGGDGRDYAFYASATSPNLSPSWIGGCSPVLNYHNIDAWWTSTKPSTVLTPPLYWY